MRTSWFIGGALALPLLVASPPASAQTRVVMCAEMRNSPSGQFSCAPLSGGFNYQGELTPLAVDSSGETATMVAPFVSVVVTNVGSKTVYCRPGAGVTTSSQPIVPGGRFEFQLGSASTVGCVAGGGDTSTVNVVQGWGEDAGGGGGGGTGGTNSVTQGTTPWVESLPDANDAAGGSTTDAACAAYNTASCTRNQLLRLLAQIAGGPIAAGANVIGKVGIDQTTPGTTNAVSNASGDPCANNAWTYASIYATTATTTRIITGTSSNHAYICELIGVPGAADNIALVEGASSCSSPTAMSGGPSGAGNATANGGWNFASAGNGFSFGSGGRTAFKTAGTNVDVCLMTSAATTLAGTVAYVLAP